MNTAETMRAERYRVIRQTCRELKAKIEDYTTPRYADPARDAEVIATAKRMLEHFRKEAVMIQAEIDFESGEIL